MATPKTFNVFGVATQEIWSFVLCIVLDKVTHTMKFDTQTHKKHVCVCICVTLRNSVTRYPISSRFDLHGIVRENRRNRHNYFQPKGGVSRTAMTTKYLLLLAAIIFFFHALQE